MRRVSIVGNSGSGKSTLGRGLAARLDVPYIELDAIYHQAGWTPLNPDTFLARVGEIASGDGWVIDGNYRAVRPVIWERADTVVWVDPPRHVVMQRVTWRTLSRAVTRRELWNGNREQWRNILSRDENVNILLWAWRSHAKYRDRFSAAMADPAHADLRFIRVQRRADARRLLA